MIYKATIFLLSYNQEKFIYEALTSVLNQDYDDVRIIISDDNSQDNTFDIIKNTLSNYKGNKCVILNKNIENLGLVGHLNKLIINYPDSEYVFLAAGDDISLPERVKITLQYFDNYNDCYAVVSKKILINENSDLVENFDDETALSAYTLNSSLKELTFIHGGVALAFRKELFDFFGSLNFDCPTEDSTIRLRALLLGKIYYINKKLSLYRIHDNNMSSWKNLPRLKISLIIKQFKKDVDMAFNYKLINKEMYNKLSLKIWFYKKYQIIIISRIRNNLFVRVYLKILLKIYDCMNWT